MTVLNPAAPDTQSEPQILDRSAPVFVGEGASLPVAASSVGLTDEADLLPHDLAEALDTAKRRNARLRRRQEIALAQASTSRFELSRAEADIADLQAQLERERQMAEIRAVMQQRVIAAQEHQLVALRQTLAYRLGEVLVHGFKSWRGAAHLPRELAALRREMRARRDSGPKGAIRRLDPRFVQKLAALLDKRGFAAAKEAIDGRTFAPAARAAAFTELARKLQPTDPAQAAHAARLAFEADPQPFRSKWLAFRLYDAGYLTEPAAILSALPADVPMTGSESVRAAQIQGQERVWRARPYLPHVAKPVYKPRPNAMLYVAASCQPYHLTGYTTRTHALAEALAGAGIDLTVVTRPGYPWDRSDRTGNAAGRETEHLGLTYRHLRHPAQSLPLDLYIEQSASAIAKVAREKKVRVIHAASNHINALPALIAARRLGIAFHYEMRGLWEMSRASKVPQYENSERYALGLELEAYVAGNADKVFAISEPLAQFIRANWMIDPERISILPNGVNSAEFSRIEAQRPAAFTIGYAGALVPYEGLDLLIEAIAMLRERGIDVRLEIAGDGESAAALESQVRQLGIEDRVAFHGKIPPHEARALLARTSLVCIPRRPDKVCEIIPPIKLTEAMAIGVPVLVPDLPVFRAEAVPGTTAFFFVAGNAESLASAIEANLSAPETAADVAGRARKHALEKRDWNSFAADMAEGVAQAKSTVRRAAGVRMVPSALSNADAAPKVHLDESLLLETFLEHGAQAVIDLVGAQPMHSPRAQAQWLMRASKLLVDAGHEETEVQLIEAAIALEPTPEKYSDLAVAANRAVDIEKAYRAIRTYSEMIGTQPSEVQLRRERLLKRLASYELMSRDLVVPPAGRAYEPVPGRVCYVLHNSLPYASGGYATRSDGVLGGLRANGVEVIAVTRPGFPLDVKKDLSAKDIPLEEEINGNRYHRLLEPGRNGISRGTYTLEIVDVLEAAFRELRPAVVWGASFYITALPAMIAARRLGIPFVYEIRGLAEITAISRNPDYAKTADYKVQVLMETLTAKEADLAVTLTSRMRDLFIERGVPADKLLLLPNSCNPEQFSPRERHAPLAAELGIPPSVPVIGYIGTFVDYEGLDDLAAACALLRERGNEFRLLLVGSENTATGSERGPITSLIAQIAEQHGFGDWLIMPGRVPHDQVENYYSLVDIAPFPRRPLPVCEIVSPMKPLEAMAMEKAVVVSSVHALSEMVIANETGLVFEKGSVESLANTLEQLMGDADLRQRLAAAARRWVEAERTWKMTTGRVADQVMALAAASQTGA